MKKFALLLVALSFLTACGPLTNDLLNAKKEASEAVNNLANEAIETKENIETRVEQIQNAAESVSNAVEAVNEASSDLKALTNEVTPEDTEEEPAE